ncbi:hypothetical protein C6341_g6154 [Phytophthora cactorum]|nr:hypothetical protein C6341_g6154 [Phytophthora cactorum]
MGGKKRYVMNPFPSMELSAGDKVQLQKTANGFLVECLHSYEMFLKEGGHNVDERRWKPLKTRENLRLFLEREVRTTTDGNHSMMNEASEQAGTPVSLCIGKMQGTLDDVVFGTVSTTSEDMCFNATRSTLVRRYQRAALPSASSDSHAAFRHRHQSQLQEEPSNSPSSTIILTALTVTDPMPAWGPSPFEPLQLSVENAAKLGEIARVFVQDSMRSYEKYLYEDQRRLDERRWKLTKQRDGVQVYVEQPLKERRKVGGASQDELEREYRRQLQCTAAGEKVTAAAAASLADLPLLLAVGTIAGTLDDAIQEREGLVDVYVRAILNPCGSIIRSLVVRSVADAIISVTEIAECAQKKKLAWLAKTSRENRRRRVMQTAVAAVVEANRTNSPTAQSNVTSTTSSSATTRPSVPLPVSETPASTSAMEKCTSCQKRSVHRSPSGSLVNTYDKRLDRNRCKLCYKFVCSSCRVKHKLTFMKPQGGLLRRDLRFCGRCVDRARAADTMAIASEELASRYEFSEFYQSLSPRFNGSSGRSIGI